MDSSGAQIGDRLRDGLDRARESLALRIDGEEHVPAEGPAVLALNHLTALDRPGLRLAGRRVHFLASSPRPSGLRGLVRRRGQQEEGDPRLAEALAVLQDGGLVALYPEGGRTPDGVLHRGEDLAARIVRASGAPLLPVAVLDDGNLLARTTGSHLVVTPALDVDRFRGDDLDEQLCLAGITDALMHRLVRATGQRYVDLPVQERRERLRHERRSRSEAARSAARARKAREQAELQRRIAERHEEAAELARIQAEAARAAREHARRAAEADALRRGVQQVRMPPAPGVPRREPGREPLHEPFGGQHPDRS